MQSARKLSPRAVATIMMLMSALLFFWVFVAEETSGPSQLSFSDIPIARLFQYGIAMALGGVLAGYVLSGCFGRRGWLGWALALAGGVIASLIAGACGSALALVPEIVTRGWGGTDLVAMATGALIVPLSLVEYPVLAVLWLALVGIAHLWSRSSRRRLAG